MNRQPETRRSLLVRIREAEDRESWDSFVDIYAPMIHAYAVRKGLQTVDAEDVTQQVMRSVFQAIPEFDYDPGKGSFRGWLFTITRNHVYKSLERRARIPTVTGDTTFHRSLQDQEDPRDEEAAWNRDHELHLFRCAADRVKQEFRTTTWQSFWATAVESQTPEEVARKLNCSVGAVYIAKSRVIARLRTEIELLEKEIC